MYQGNFGERPCITIDLQSYINGFKAQIAQNRHQTRFNDYRNIILKSLESPSILQAPTGSTRSLDLETLRTWESQFGLHLISLLDLTAREYGLDSLAEVYFRPLLYASRLFKGDVLTVGNILAQC